MATGRNGTFAQVPSNIEIYVYIINSSEATLYLISIITNGIFLIVLKRTPEVHRDLSLLIANMIIFYMIIAIT